MICVIKVEMYRIAQNSVNWLVKFTWKYVRSFFITSHRIFRYEILHVQCSTHNAVVPFYKQTGRFKSEHSR
jgi:hypothetical protein